MRDFDLRNRLFRFRCSYMIESAAFRGMPKELKQRVYYRIYQALDLTRPDPELLVSATAGKAGHPGPRPALAARSPAGMVGGGK